MIRTHYDAGAQAALRKFKLANAGVPNLSGQAPTPAAGAAMGSPAVRPPGPVTPAAPVASGATKSRVLG